MAINSRHYELLIVEPKSQGSVSPIAAEFIANACGNSPRWVIAPIRKGSLVLRKTTKRLPCVLLATRERASRGAVTRLALTVTMAFLISGAIAAVNGLVQRSSVAEAHTVQIAWRVESNCDVTWFAGSYHDNIGVSGGIVIDGSTYAFTSSPAALPGDVDGSVSAAGAPGVMKWQAVTVSGLAAGTHNVTTTATSGVEVPWPDFAPVIDLSDCRTPFDWTGLFPPIDNSPTGNVVKAGSAVPVKFSLNGDQGLDIFAVGFPAAVLTPCTGGAPSEEVTESAGGIGLQYDPATDEYTYVWKTDKSWAGFCAELQVKLVDGITHTANFQFK